MEIDDSIEQKVSNFIINDALQGDATDFTRDTDLITIAAIDSLSMMDLVAFLEDTFGIEISPGDLNPTNLTSVATIAAMVRRLSV